MFVSFHQTADSRAFDTLPYEEAAAHIDFLSGRKIGSYILGTVVPATQRRTGREGAYVACARGMGRRGFVVRVHR